MRFHLLFDHPTFGKVRYGEEGILTSDGRKVILVEYEIQTSGRRRPIKAYQGFYQSSGMISRQPGTWFPFDGDVVNSATGEGLLLKLDTTTFAKQFKTFAQSSDVPLQKNLIKFGTLLFLYVSYKIGDGIWTRPREVSKIKSRVPRSVWKDDDGVESGWDMSKIRFGRAYRSPKEVNLFLGSALSMNFLKGTEYPATMNGDWILDYKEIYRGKQFLFYPKTRIEFERRLLTVCKNGDEPILLDFMIQYDHSLTSLANFFYPSMAGLSIFEHKFCQKFRS